MKKFLIGLLALIAILTGVYFLGPKPATPKYDAQIENFNVPINKLDSVVAQQEKAFDIKPDNQSQIIWADSSKQDKTEYCILYLPGFSASQGEGAPVHTNIAKKYKCNLYLARLYGHGLKDTLHTFEDYTADKYWASAVNAYSIAKQLGNKVIVMSTSTGGTLSVKLLGDFPEIAGQILMSPNMEIYDPNSWVLNNNWGAKIASMVKGSDTLFAGRRDSAYKYYWNTRYSINGAVELQQLIETTMQPSTFAKIKQPTLLLYYYKDEENQDKVVSVKAMKKMFEQISTPANAKQETAIPNAGNHVLGNPLLSNDVPMVEKTIDEFMKKQFFSNVSL